MMKFSIPLNPKLSEKSFYHYVEFCQKYKEHIYDIYFTSRIPPFVQDAMGDVFIGDSSHAHIVENALELQSSLGIKVSATFNNVQVRPDQKNLDTWIKSFAPLYKAGVRSCTLPFTTWMLTGQIQSEYPELFIKNTILNGVTEARQVASLAEAGFHYVNLHRDLMRDHDRLREIKKVKDKYDVKLSLLANEGCLGNCPIMPEHYHFNNTRSTGPQYFNDPISRISCSHWVNNNEAYELKTAVFSPWREDWIEYEELGIDVIKMHGRESEKMLMETMSIMTKFIAGEEIVYEKFDTYIKERRFENNPINAWRKKIKTCKFNCWECNYCDKIWAAKKNSRDEKVRQVSQIIIDSVNSKYTNDVEGLSSARTKKLLNELGKISTSYLEIGVLNGSTFRAAVENNDMVSYAVDNWKANISAQTNDVIISSSKEEFKKNISNIKRGKAYVYDCDFRTVDLSSIDSIDLFFYDADHDEKSTSEAVQTFSSKFIDGAILIFDDANFDGVVRGATEGISKSGLNVVFERLVLNDIEDPDQWWNGLYICVVERNNK